MTDWKTFSWDKVILPVIGGILVWFQKKFNILRLKPKENAEVSNLTQDIEAKRNKITMEILATAEAQLSKTNERLEHEEMEKEKYRRQIEQLYVDLEGAHQRINKLEQSLKDSINALNEERSHCNSVRKQLDTIKNLLPEHIKKEYGIN